MFENQIKMQAKRQEVLDKFKNVTTESMHKSAMVNRVVHALMHDANPYQIIEDLMDCYNVLADKHDAWVMNGPAATPIIIQKDATYMHAFPVGKTTVMKKRSLFQLTDAQYIEMATIVDNNFNGGTRTIVERDRVGFKRVYTHTQGGQCILADVKFEIKDGEKLLGVYTQDEEPEAPAPYCPVGPITFAKVIAYLESKNYAY